MGRINSRKLINELIVQWLDKNESIDEADKKLLYEIATDYCGRDISFLYEINKILYSDAKKWCSDSKTGLLYKKEKDKHFLIYRDEKIEISYLQFREIVTTFIDILEKIYPLGTVVELKKEYISKVVSNKDIQSAAVVIVNRFISVRETNTYFTYSGVVYPIGDIGNGRQIHFTSSLIEKVLHEGFTDEREETYMYLMKKEVIIDKGMHSFGFATEEENNKLSSQIGAENRK